MAYDTSAFDSRAEEIISWLQKEFGSIRTGRATPVVLDSVQVSAYGARVPLNQVGSIGVEDPRTLRVSVWDAGQIKEVEKAIIDADLGVSVLVDEKGLRVVFPELTGERREQLLKQAKGRQEEARVSLRAARDEAMKEIDGADMSEDEQFSAREDLQKHVDQYNARLTELFEAKEREIQQ